MKVCPQCNSVYADDFLYCSNDGTTLVEESLELPSEAGDESEAETVIRRRGAPVIVDLNELTPDEAFEADERSATAEVRPIVVEKTSNPRAYALFLLIGLLLGGFLVLATLLAARYVNFSSETNAPVQTKQEGAGKPSETPAVERDNEIDRLADDLHRKRAAGADDDEFNGRVIAQNAYVRSAPSAGAAQVDILPTGDRLNIERRENAGSPWYYVSCEHGIAGWMHGNTIEFTSGNF
jgi:hypothetical protein